MPGAQSPWMFSSPCVEIILTRWNVWHSSLPTIPSESGLHSLVAAWNTFFTREAARTDKCLDFMHLRVEIKSAQRNAHQHTTQRRPFSETHKVWLRHFFINLHCVLTCTIMQMVFALWNIISSPPSLLGLDQHGKYAYVHLNWEVATSRLDAGRTYHSNTCTY